MYSKSSIIKFLQGDAGTQCSMPRFHAQSPQGGVRGRRDSVLNAQRTQGLSAQCLGVSGTQCSMPRGRRDSVLNALGSQGLSAQCPGDAGTQCSMPRGRMDSVLNAQEQSPRP